MFRSFRIVWLVVLLGGLFVAGGCGPQKNLALNVAAQHGTKDDMERALATGASVNQVGESNNTPLIEAAIFNNSDAAQFRLPCSRW